jgi:DNA-binding IclR family transcriptional regulator
MPPDASPEAPTPAGAAPRTAVAKVLALLLAFEGDRVSLGLTELAQQVGLPLSTTHRLVGELVDAGFLRREPTGRYRVSRRVWKIGQNAGRVLQETARPPLAELFRVTGRVSQLAIRDGRDTLIADRVFGPGQATQVSRVGDRLPLHASAVGKAILAFEERSIQDGYLAQPLDGITAATLVDPVVLARQFATIRRDGYAFSAEEARVGSASIAVPVLVGRERPVAAVGLIAPSAQARRLAGLLPALRSAANALALDAPRWPHVGAGEREFYLP